MHLPTATRNPVSCTSIATDATDDTTLRERLREAIRACRGTIIQDQVAEQAGIGQSTLSAYESGKSDPTALVLHAIEKACGRPAGWIFVRAGLISQVTSVLDAIEMDPRLPDGARDTMRLLYQGTVKDLSEDGRRSRNG